MTPRAGADIAGCSAAVLTVVAAVTAAAAAAAAEGYFADGVLSPHRKPSAILGHSKCELDSCVAH